MLPGHRLQRQWQWKLCMEVTCCMGPAMMATHRLMRSRLRLVDPPGDQQFVECW